jgi:hypothetical protein
LRLRGDGLVLTARLGELRLQLELGGAEVLNLGLGDGGGVGFGAISGTLLLLPCLLLRRATDGDLLLLRRAADGELRTGSAKLRLRYRGRTVT